MALTLTLQPLPSKLIRGKQKVTKHHMQHSRQMTCWHGNICLCVYVSCYDSVDRFKVEGQVSFMRTFWMVFTTLTLQLPMAVWGLKRGPISEICYFRYFSVIAECIHHCCKQETYIMLKAAMKGWEISDWLSVLARTKRQKDTVQIAVVPETNNLLASFPYFVLLCLPDAWLF